MIYMADVINDQKAYTVLKLHVLVNFSLFKSAELHYDFLRRKSERTVGWFKITQ